MASKIFGPRKQRTREHVIADLSVHHVEGYIIEEGHTAQRLDRDYGYDLVLSTYDENGYLKPGSVYIQLKATETVLAVGSDRVFDLDTRDYNLWTMEEMPVILVLFDASLRRGYWLCVQNYFREEAVRGPKKGAKTVRVRLPTRRRVNRKAVSTWRDLKWTAFHRSRGGEP